MASRSTVSFAKRAEQHNHPLVKKLFLLAEKKQSNVVLSADLTTTKDLLDLADNIVDDFSQGTIEGLTRLSNKHEFLIFEDRKFVDIGNTVQKQYKGGVLKIHDWAHIVNCTVLPGPGIVQALEQTIQSAGVADRGVLILAEMTSKGSLATGSYTRASIDIAQQYPKTIMGWVATKELSQFAESQIDDEDFVVFTTGVNISSKGDALGQQYQTPTSAMASGSDFLIAGRGIYAASDPVAAVKEYQKAGWDAYKTRVGRTADHSSQSRM
ncbi:orotidine 5'-phosphate decarboxylase [Lithohypha guttulata]|uniref:Orotidine 5'-phosphate decarboxylase n=1 Tax=Lithohypha guttulata TaxID=1690604 RepID=A0ABR0K9F1_9EURO|nr:orotidine 5'-phosphate decarboxylase [Lithohypha guttulata]